MALGLFGIRKKKLPTATPAEEYCEKRIVNISPKLIFPNPTHPRRNFGGDAIITLADSISKYGFIQPLVVRLTDEGTYELVAGERRLRAAKLLHLERVPCMILPGETDLKMSAELATVENTQRVQLDFFEQASAIRDLMTVCSYTQNEAAERLSLSQPEAANKLKLLLLSKSERAAITDAGLTERHAKALLSAPSGKRMLIIGLAEALSLDAAETERLCKLAAENSEISDTALENEAKKINDDADNTYNNMKKSAHTEEKSACNKPGDDAKIGVRNLEIFVNSFERIAKLAEKAGANVEKSVETSDDCLEMHLRIFNKRHDKQF